MSQVACRKLIKTFTMAILYLRGMKGTTLKALTDKAKKKQKRKKPFVGRFVIEHLEGFTKTGKKRNGKN